MAVALTLCTVCDAPPGRCQHGAARYLEPIIYDKVIGPDGRPMFRVPRHELARWEKGPARPSQAASSVRADTDPWKCVKCRAPLTRWAYLKGFRHCSRSCRESDSP